MIEVLTDFVAELRRAGLPVSTQESIDAALAISKTPLDERSRLRSTLAATLLKSAEHSGAIQQFQVVCQCHGVSGFLQLAQHFLIRKHLSGILASQMKKAAQESRFIDASEQ